jgi:hypothetical protein
LNPARIVPAGHERPCSSPAGTPWGWPGRQDARRYTSRGRRAVEPRAVFDLGGGAAPTSKTPGGGMVALRRDPYLDGRASCGMFAGTPHRL